VHLQHLWLIDFRNHAETNLVFAPGLTVLRGANGAGKTNVLEAAGYLATLSSFRGASPETMVRQGSDAAVVRGEISRAGRSLLVETEIRPGGRSRTSLNRQPVRRVSELREALAVTVFSPDDLELVKGGPSGRRRYLDDALVAVHPRNEQVRRDYERIVRQRNALLASAHGRLTPDVETTLGVWDTKLTSAGEALAGARVELLGLLEPAVRKAYEQFAGGRETGPRVSLSYETSWRGAGLAASLLAARSDELRRGLSLVGPHRDDVGLALAGMAARTCASQGEQRSLALAMRLAVHRLVAEEAGETPVLLLDDVFSELDESRGAALLDNLPAGQAILTTTGAAPLGLSVERELLVDSGRVQGP
jgi:DNA replication and repair protein RecF